MVLNDVKEEKGGSAGAELRPLPSSSLDYAYTNEQGQPETIQRCKTVHITIKAILEKIWEEH